MNWYAQWRLETDRERWRREDLKKKEQALAEFWESDPPPEAEAVLWHFGCSMSRHDIQAYLDARDAPAKKALFEGHTYRFLFPAVQAARAARIPVESRGAWIEAKVESLRDEFNNDPANAMAPMA